MTLKQARERANALCRQYRRTSYVLHDSMDEPGEYRILFGNQLSDRSFDNNACRYSAEWTGHDVHGTRS